MALDRLTTDSRLAYVRDTGLLDAEQDAQLDRLNRLAVELLGVPVSLVSLVDEDRQFFAGQVGLPEPWASYRETPLSHSFCRYVVEREAQLVVPDARLDPLVAENLAVRDLGAVAYAGVPLRLSDGSVLGAFCAIDGRPREWSEHDIEILSDLAELARDLIELKRDRARPRFRDALTGLPDRTMFQELVERALPRAAREGDCTSVIAIALDGFRLINEALGHAAGDRVLRAVADRLAQEMRGEDVVCRLAGDVFLVLCDSARDEADALLIADRLRQAVIGEPVRLDGQEQRLAATASAACSSTQVDADELIDAALARLSAAKRATQEGAIPPPSETRAGAVRRLQLRNDIGRAPERGELHLLYQPVVDLASGRVAKIEALVRWTHPEQGPVGPDVFIPAAEQSGAIVKLGEWVLEEAIGDFCSWWSRRQPHSGELTLAVNVAPLQLRTANFVDIVRSALGTCSIPGSALTLEITERTLLDERITGTSTLERLRGLGVKLALDDFGTGYSALGYLTRVPVDVVKIDRSFVSAIDTDHRSAALVSGIVTLARGLQLASVAEGIETEEQLAAVRRLGCDYGQGYLLGRPQPAEDVAKLLR
jgi:diguanylate cyclase (GGDEF)-like protein